MSEKKEFEMHNGKGVLYGRYSTDQFQDKYRKLWEEKEILKEELISLQALMKAQNRP